MPTGPRPGQQEIKEFAVKPYLLAAAVAAVLLSGAPALAQDASTPAYQAAVADALRPAEEVERDA